MSPLLRALPYRNLYADITYRLPPNRTGVGDRQLEIVALDDKKPSAAAMPGIYVSAVALS